MKSSDVALQESVRLEDVVLSRLGGRIRNFRVLLQEDGLVLQGRAPSYYTKQLAQQAVMEATRIPILRNAIEVTWN